MILNTLKSITATQRAPRDDFLLGCLLTFVAGATNAGGYLAVKVYTSHMSGIVASMADNLVLGDLVVVFSALGALLAFMVGAATTAVLVNWARRKQLHSAFALPLALESLLLLLFGLMGGSLISHALAYVSLVVMVLCFLMGLQNALITKISNARIRTTHITGMVTDLGIELGKLFYWNNVSHHHLSDKVVANRGNISMLSTLICLFFVGGLVGAFAFKYVGFVFAVPLSVALGMLSCSPIFKDLQNAQ
jgi:uncharacterized membrane protein YoaK (UPF0700 family)